MDDFFTVLVGGGIIAVLAGGLGYVMGYAARDRRWK